jgi:hypothetical protein
VDPAGLQRALSQTNLIFAVRGPATAKGRPFSLAVSRPTFILLRVSGVVMSAASGFAVSSMRIRITSIVRANSA